MQNIPPGLIPYNHEKYLTGKYIAETRGGFRPDEVVYLNNVKFPVLYGVESDIMSCREDGMYLNEKAVHISDLFLRPKTVKKYFPLFKNTDVYNSKEECEKIFSQYSSFLKAVEVEVKEE